METNYGQAGLDCSEEEVSAVMDARSQRHAELQRRLISAYNEVCCRDDQSRGHRHWKRLLADYLSGRPIEMEFLAYPGLLSAIKEMEEELIDAILDRRLTFAVYDLDREATSKARNQSEASIEERIRGCLFGLAAGERNGGPVRMVLRVGQSLVERGGFDPEDIFSRYRDWWKEGAIDTGNVFAGVMNRMDYGGMTRREAVAWVDNNLSGRTAGVNPAHRVAPLACFLGIRDGELASMAREEAQLTHASPIAGDTSAVVAVLLRALIRGVEWQRALAIAMRQIRHPETRRGRDAGVLPAEENGFAPTILANAIYFVDRADSFDSALEASLKHAGGANYSPVLVGAIAGALFAPSCEGVALNIHGDEVASEAKAMIGKILT